MTDIRWQQYRDESQRAPVVKVAELAQAYVTKTGHAPQVIGVPPSFPEADRAKLAGMFQVLACVPAWAKHEIWLGVDHGA
jgi:hypothetical protein